MKDVCTKSQKIDLYPLSTLAQPLPVRADTP